MFEFDDGIVNVVGLLVGNERGNGFVDMGCWIIWKLMMKKGAVGLVKQSPLVSQLTTDAHRESRDF